MREFRGLDQFEGAVGTHLGYSEWHTITQERIDAFADATQDHQWIHVDPERAATGPFGTTIAHGYLTLSLLSKLLDQIYRIDGLSAVINYGVNRVRFPSAVAVGSRIRAGAGLVEVAREDGRVRAVVEAVVECEGSSKPVCVAECVGLLIP